MGLARARLLDLIGKADVLCRFGLYIPVARHGTPIYVHAKILIMDDRLMRGGSSKINNRSPGFDAECDLSVEAPPGATGRTSGYRGPRGDGPCRASGGRGGGDGADARADGRLPDRRDRGPARHGAHARALRNPSSTPSMTASSARTTCSTPSGPCAGGSASTRACAALSGTRGRHCRQVGRGRRARGRVSQVCGLGDLRLRSIIQTRGPKIAIKAIA
jgi:hypothetical protein